MTKKFLLAFILVTASISPVFSAESDYPIDEQFTESIAKFAQNIMNHNEHAFEQKLVGKQLEYSEWESTLTYSPCLKAGDSGLNKPCLPKQVLQVLLQWPMPQPCFIILQFYI